MAFRIGELVPYRRFTIRTAWTPEQVQAGLAPHVDKRSAWPFPGGGLPRPFRGRVDVGRFEITPIIDHRNSFLPVVLGDVRPHPRGGWLVEVRMRMNVLVIAFMTVWMLGATAGALVGLGAALLTGQMTGLLVIVMPIVGGAMMGLGFRSEANRAEQFLRELFPQFSGEGPYRGATGR